MTAPSLTEQVSDRLLLQFAELIYQRVGVRISPQKKTLLSNRLRRRLRSTGIAGFDAYFEHLRRLPQDDAEWDAFLQEITTHETFLFRDETHWEWFRAEFLGNLAAQARAGQRPKSLRIWSAACSTGDEAATMACCIAATLVGYESWKIAILGTDIGIEAIERAKSGQFGERAMRLVPEDYRRKFFQHAGGTRIWQLKPALQSLLAFRQHNLMEPLPDAPFDLVVLKNVLIYFDSASKQHVLRHVRGRVAPGGFLLCGAAEGAGDHLKSMVRLQPWLFRQPAEGPGR